MSKVILVNNKDEQVGTKEKLQAHKEGDLHRAFSVLLFNSKGDLLIHRRAENKYHCGGLWTNACCSHPLPGETTLEAAKRRLKEELGYDFIEVSEKLVFQYKAVFDNGLTENEIDHVLMGFTDQDPPQADKSEIAEWKWESMNSLKSDMKKNPQKYTVWFRKIMNRIKS